MFNAEGGNGFITLSNDGKDIFVHVTALERSGLTSLSEGQSVVVDVVEGRKGLEAPLPLCLRPMHSDTSIRSPNSPGLQV